LRIKGVLFDLENVRCGLESVLFGLVSVLIKVEMGMEDIGKGIGMYGYLKNVGMDMGIWV
jgi:hypothetical protein